MERKMSLPELREIVFWQQLNKQLMSMKRRGSVILPEYHDRLYRFCTDNDFYANVIDKPVLIDIPLALVSNFEDIFFVTYHQRPWMRLLSALMSFYALDINRAFGGTYNTLMKLEKKYSAPEDDDEEPDDMRLYDLIDQYTGLKTKRGLNMPETMKTLYRLKSSTMNNILRRYDCRRWITIKEEEIYLELGQHEYKENIMAHYLKNFCEKALRSIGDWNIFLHKWDLYGFLAVKLDEPDLSPSVRSFLQTEENILKQEESFITAFEAAAQGRLSEEGNFNIPICHTSPFSFFHNPLPLV